MLNTTILDVAIGMTFIYLLMSLLCSAANELIELLLKKRATDLERGIRELLKPDSTSGGADIVQKLYDHPLINGLFPGKYDDSRIGTRARYLIGTKLPSYIPAKNFALALMDLVLPGSGTGTPSGAAGATAPSPPKTPAAAPGVAAPTVPPPPNAPAVTVSSTSAFRAAIAKLKTTDPQIAIALTTLVDAAGDDIARARANIEDWFNSSMDRVSGWYKRRTQIFLLILGLLVAVLLNVDSVLIFRRLASDRPLRDSLVAAADAYAKANASPSPTPLPSGAASSKTEPAAGAQPPKGSTPGAATPTPTQTATRTASPTSTPSPSPVTSPTGAGATPSSSPAASASPTPKPSPTPCWQEACEAGTDTPQCKLAKAQCQIRELTLPIGWSSQNDAELMLTGDNWPRHFFGWLLTALAISLGAPFWFDMLNKFIVVRSTVKPKEKSPEEKPK